MTITHVFRNDIINALESAVRELSSRLMKSLPAAPSIAC
jgi:hypothetical protein